MSLEGVVGGLDVIPMVAFPRYGDVGVSVDVAAL